MHWTEIIDRLPYVCERCSRRFPILPRKGKCPDHPTGPKVVDQTGLLAERGIEVQRTPGIPRGWWEDGVTPDEVRGYSL